MLLWIVAGIIVLLTTLLILLQTCWFQNFIVGKITTYLSKKLNTTVQLEEVNLSFPKSVYLKNFFIADQKKDTLLYAHELTVDLNMLGLLKNELSINSVSLSGATAHIYRSSSDSSFNFDFIVAAFSSGKPAAPVQDTTASTFNVLLGKVILDKIYFTLNDEVGGMVGAARIGHLQVGFEEFNPGKEKMLINRLDWNNSYAHFRQTKIIPADTTASSPISLQLGARHLQLDSLDLSYADTSSQLNLLAKISSLSGDPDTIDINRMIFDFKKLNAENTTVAVGMASDTSIKKTTASSVTTDTSSTDVIIRCDQLALTNFDFQYDDKSAAPVKEGIDYSHLHLTGVTGDFSNISYQGLAIAVDIHQMQAKEQSGLNLKEGRGKFRMTDTGITFEDGLIVTDESTIRNSAGISYSSLSEISNDIGKLGVTADLKNATIAVKDILYFYPPLAENEYVKPSIDRVLNVDGVISGTLDNLTFQNLKVRTQSTEVWASGSIKGLPDVDKLSFEMKLGKFSSTKEELLALLPDSLLPSSIEIPESFTLTGNYQGTLDNFKANGKIESSMGNAVIAATMKPVPGKNIKSYNTDISLEDFNLGKFLKQEENFGLVNASAKINGEGFTLDDMHTSIDATVKNAEVNGYNYQDAVVKGKIAGKMFSGHFSINDKAVALSFDGRAGLASDTSSSDFQLDVKHADLQQLNFYKDELKFSGKAVGKFTGNDLNTLNGSVYITKASITTGGKKYPLDSISLVATSQEGKYDWKLRSEMVDANYTGTSSAAIGIPILINHFNYYFNNKAYQASDTLGSPQFDFDVEFHDRNNLLPVFVDGLESLQPFTITGTFDSNSKILKLESTGTNLVYDGIHVDSLKLQAGSNPEKFLYKVSANRIASDTISLHGISVRGSALHDSINTFLRVMPDSGDIHLLLGWSLVPADNNFRLHLKPGQIIFNNEHWSAPGDNFIQFGADGFFINNLKIFKGDTFFSAASKELKPDAPLLLTFQNFDLQLFSQVFDSSQNLISGVMNGNFLLQDIKKFGFTSDLTITDLKLMHDHYGNLEVHANNNVPGKYEGALTLSGAGNGLKVNGYFMTQEPASELHFDVQLDSMNFAIIEPFTRQFIRSLGGSVSGKLTIRGTTAKPSIIGNVQFDEAGFILAYTNSVVKLGNSPIAFDESGIHFKDLSIQDVFNNKALLNGSLLTTNYQDYRFDLDFSAEDFIVMNSTAKENATYYGIIRLDCDAQLRGDLNLPDITIKTRLRDGTKFTYVYQRNDTAFNSEAGIVEFIDVRKRLHLLPEASDSLSPVLSGYRITAIVDVDDKSEFNIVLDPVSGDRLEVKGNGSFNYDLNPTGQMSLTGRYEISSGSYKLTLYNLVKREFILDKGSAITWNGDPLNADLDITGHLAVRTAPLPLLGDQSTSGNEEQLAQYKSPLDFNVFLNVQGRLTLPEIHFDVELDDKQKGALGGVVDAKLAQLRKEEAEMNQQVFALLVLGTFIAEDPLASTGSSGSSYINDVARSSVSNMLSSQLNRLSNQYIKGVDVNFDLRSVTDYSNGVYEEQTQLNVGFREKLFNDRLQIYVGTNFNIGGSTVFSATPTDLSGDFSLEYLATIDGRVRLNIFRRNTYEGIFEGQTVENGLSVIYNRDFDKLKYLFKGNYVPEVDEKNKERDEKLYGKKDQKKQ